MSATTTLNVTSFTMTENRRAYLLSLTEEAFGKDKVDMVKLDASIERILSDENPENAFQARLAFLRASRRRR
ncbi:MAG: hypothetical protein HQL31_11215, partial [Planctomycetes bacterium]|nr:hypothetical protein [Planctomycetota bacterium]